MVHPTELDMLEHLHEEAPRPVAEMVRMHTEMCPQCFRRRQDLAREESEQRRLLRALDVPVPLIRADAVLQRARRRNTAVRIAASIGLLATLASAGLAMMPGSPVRAWLRHIAAPLSAPEPGARIAVRPPPAGGVQVAVSGSLLIMLGEPQDSGEIRLVRTAGDTASVHALGGDVGYRVGPERINLDNRLPALRYDIAIPRSLERFVLLSGGRVLLQIDARHPAKSDSLTIGLSPRGITRP